MRKRETNKWQAVRALLCQPGEQEQVVKLSEDRTAPVLVSRICHELRKLLLDQPVDAALLRMYELSGGIVPLQQSLMPAVIAQVDQLENWRDEKYRPRFDRFLSELRTGASKSVAAALAKLFPYLVEQRLKDEPEFLLEIAQAEAEALAPVEQAIRSRALGMELVNSQSNSSRTIETKVDRQGNPYESMKETKDTNESVVRVAPDVKAGELILRTKNPGEWTPRRQPRAEPKSVHIALDRPKLTEAERQTTEAELEQL